MPPPDKPLPRRAGTSPSASQDEERRQTCAICLEPLSTGDPCRLLPCNHIFHTSCTDSWLEDRYSCPTCRHDIRAPEDIPAEPEEQRQQPLALRIVLLFVIVCLMSGAQSRVLDAIFGVQSEEAQHHHAWASNLDSNFRHQKVQNATKAQHRSSLLVVASPPQYSSVQQYFGRGFLHV